MNCGDARELLFAFLDNELEAAASIELQCHLDHCATCAREVEIERTIRKQLERVLAGAEAAEANAGADVEARHVPWPAECASATHPQITNTSARPKRPALLARRPVWTIAAAITITVGLGIWTFGLLRSDAPSGIRLADTLVADFEHFTDEGAKVQFASSDAGAVGSWLRQATAIAVELPAPTDPRCKLVGGRKCEIDGKPAAFAVYNMGGVLASLVTVAKDKPAWSGMKRIELGEKPFWVTRHNDITIVARWHDGLVHAAVSTLAKEELLCLLTD